jgi:F-type H+-transporting ATPase subunit a
LTSSIPAQVAAVDVAPGCENAHFEDGSTCGFPAPSTSIFDLDPYFTYDLFGITFEISKPVVLAVFGSAIIIIFFLVAFAKPRLVPGKVQSLGEMGYLFIRNGIARETIGPAGDRWVPLLFSLFFFVFIMNIFEVIPGAQFPVPSRIAFPVALALVVWVVYMYLGMRHQGPVKFFTNMMFPPGLPKPIYVLLAPIEFLSNVIIRPFTLAIRLFANMFAGHLLLTIFTVATFYLASFTFIGALGSATSFLMTVALTAFELLIITLQAYIFTLLTAVYIAGSLHSEH